NDRGPFFLGIRPRIGRLLLFKLFKMFKIPLTDTLLNILNILNTCGWLAAAALQLGKSRPPAVHYLASKMIRGFTCQSPRGLPLPSARRGASQRSSRSTAKASLRRSASRAHEKPAHWYKLRSLRGLRRARGGTAWAIAKT